MRFRIYTPGFCSATGGITVLFTLALELSKRGHESKIITWDHSQLPNPIFTTYTTPDDVPDDCFAVYPEVTIGNPLRARNVIRWILCDLGKFCSPTIYETWGLHDIVYFYSSYSQHHSRTIDTNLLTCFFVLDAYPTDTHNIPRPHDCHEYRKVALFHQQWTIFHPPTSVEVDEYNKIAIFTSSRYYFCYDPYTFNMMIAGLCGCLTVVYPLPGVSKKKWTDSLYARDYLKDKGKDFLYGIAYGIDDIPYAQETLGLFRQEHFEIIAFMNQSVSKMCTQLEQGVVSNTVHHCFYGK